MPEQDWVEAKNALIYANLAERQREEYYRKDPELEREEVESLEAFFDTTRPDCRQLVRAIGLLVHSRRSILLGSKKRNGELESEYYFGDIGLTERSWLDANNTIRQGFPIIREVSPSDVVRGCARWGTGQDKIVPYILRNLDIIAEQEKQRLGVK